LLNSMIDPSTYAYTGRELDTEDLYYYRARYYDPTTQRFLSQDPIGFSSGDFNWYRYTLNNPTYFRDPYDHWAWLLYPLAAYLFYDTISDWADYLNKSDDLCDANTPIKTPEDYLKYRERVQQQLNNSRNIGKETTLDVLKAGYPISAPIDTAIGVGYEFGK